MCELTSSSLSQKKKSLILYEIFNFVVTLSKLFYLFFLSVALLAIFLFSFSAHEITVSKIIFTFIFILITSVTLDALLVLISVLKANACASLCLPFLIDVIWREVKSMFLNVVHRGHWNFKY